MGFAFKGVSSVLRTRRIDSEEIPRFHLVRVSCLRLRV